jgi:hypothetical protein
MLQPPRITQDGDLPFSRWCETYAYYLDCIMDCVRRRTASGSAYAVDWAGVRASLERYAYATSSNRRKSYVLYT